MSGSPPSQPSDEQSSEPVPAPRTSRRRFVAAAAAGLTAATAGCSGSVPGTGSETVEPTVAEDGHRELSWEFPNPDEDGARVGGAEIRLQRRLPFGFDTPAVKLQFSAGAPLDSVWKLSRFRARFRTSEEYHQALGDVTYLVEPPGQREEFSAYHERTPVSRELVVELGGINADGAVAVPFVLDSRAEPLPKRLRCAFEVELSKPALVGGRVVASGEGWFELDAGE